MMASESRMGERRRRSGNRIRRKGTATATTAAAALVLCSVLGRANAATATTTALSVPPSANWYGDDGSWSAVSIRVGQPPQWVDVFVSTVSSETWVVGQGGCGSSDSQCQFIRGGVFNPTKSTTWQNQGLFELGADKQLGNDGYAQYGLDSLTFGGTGVNISSTIIGAFNGTGSTSTTSYLLGLLGLGVVPGSFNASSPLSALSALVEQVGAVPSHSWGYTAGAKYQQKGVVNSLTLGGYDSVRFVPHNTTFNLDSGKQLLTFVSSISVASSNSSNNWATPVELLNPSDQVSAIIDSSTPFLWLPQAVCERFAQTLGLTYDSSLNLYTFDGNATQRDTLSASQLSFSFSLADISSTPATINITLPYAAFDLQLTYPAIPFTTFGAANSTKYYFPLRQAASAAQYTIGRAFLQEAYLITDYERNTFSVHQAVHPTDSVGNTSIVSIMSPSTSTFTGNPKTSSSKVSTGAIAGIAVGAAGAIALAAFAIFFICRRKHQRSTDNDSEKSLSESSQPRTFLDRLRGRHSSPSAQDSALHEVNGSSCYPTEVGADATHERFELPAPLGPAELDTDSSNGSYDGTTEHGSATQESQNLSSYERARRKMERQQAAFAHIQDVTRDAYPIEKSEQDTSQVAHYRASEAPSIDSPLVSPFGAESHYQDSLTISGQTSPISPGFVSAPPSPFGPPPTYRRINPENVVYAGRLPNNVRLPNIVPRVVGPDGRTVQSNSSVESGHNPENQTDSSLGSQYTNPEATDLYGSGSGASNIVSPLVSGNSGSGLGSDSGSSNAGHTDPVSSLGSSGGGETRGPASERGALREDTMLSRNMSILDPRGSRRRLDGEDLVHVPQPAENRFSWEEERISGLEEEERRSI